MRGTCSLLNKHHLVWPILFIDVLDLAVVELWSSTPQGIARISGQHKMSAYPYSEIIVWNYQLVTQYIMGFWLYLYE